MLRISNYLQDITLYIFKTKQNTQEWKSYILKKKTLVKQPLRIQKYSEKETQGVNFNSVPTIFNIEEGFPEFILSASNSIIF